MSGIAKWFSGDDDRKKPEPVPQPKPETEIKKDQGNDVRKKTKRTQTNFTSPFGVKTAPDVATKRLLGE